jgi:hypothetical protein
MQTQLQTIIRQTIQKHYNITLDEVKLDIPPKKEL